MSLQNIITSAFSFSSPQIISTITAVGVFFVIIFIAVIRDELKYKYERKAKGTSNEWLFSHWDTKLYDVLTSKKPEETLKSLGVDTETYLKDCSVIKNYFPNLKKLAADKLIGVVLIFLSIILVVISREKGVALNAIILLVGIILYQGDVGKVHKEANAKRRKLEVELPRYLDLLETALYINLPVSEAIIVTAKNLKGTMISDELLATMAESQIGVTSWQDALENIAQKYEVDTFSDFVQYLVVAYEKGLPIYDVVSRQAREVRSTEKTNARANANKINTSIILPIAIYKLFPVIAMIAYPIAVQYISNGGF